MGYVVAKPFKTVNRKFAAGDAVAPEDIQGAVDFDTWKAREFIKSDEPAAGPSRQPFSSLKPAKSDDGAAD